MELIGNTLEDLWVTAAQTLVSDGAKHSPRGLATRELLGVQLVLTDPRARIPKLPVRQFSLAYAMGELAWYVVGDDSLEFIRHYAPSYGKYSDDGKRLHGAYGPRIFGPDHWFGASRPHHPSDPKGWEEHLAQCQPSQWDRVKEILRHDPDSRQAVIAIYGASDTGRVTKDMPCTLSLQFLLRDGKLDLVVNMRSNDLWFGGVYDIFCFTALQELMSNELGVRMGTYYHHVGSLHLYERNLPAILDCLAQYEAPAFPGGVPPLIDKSNTMEALARAEKLIRAMPPVEALEEICRVADAWPLLPTLWDLGKMAWRWKRVLNSAEIKEEQRRYARSVLDDRLGMVFERCFF